MEDTLVKVDEETWVNPSQVAAVAEEFYPDGACLVRVLLKGTNRTVTLSGTRGATVVALLTDHKDEES